MIVRNDISILADNYARTEAVLPLLLGRATLIAETEELAETRIVEKRKGRVAARDLYRFGR